MTDPAVTTAARRASAVLVGFALVAGITIVVHLISDVMIDLRVYRVGARALLDGAPLYEARDVTGLPFTYTPFAALVFVPAALLPFTLSMFAATVIAALALIRSAWLVVRAARGGRFADPRSLRLVALLVIVMALTEPVGATLGFGQINLLILWLVLEDLLGDLPPRWRGVLIGLAAGLKLTPAIFVGYLLVTRRWADAARAVATGAATVAVGFALQPGQAWSYWTGVAYDSDRVGEVEFAGNQSLRGVLERLAGPDAPPALWLLVAGAVGVLGLATAAALHSRRRKLEAVTAVGLTMLLVSPVSWSHHWVWLLPLLGLGLTPQRSRAARAWLGVAAAVLVSRCIWLADYRHGAEFGTSGPLLAAQNAYSLLAIGGLGWLAATARRSTRCPDRNLTG